MVLLVSSLGIILYHSAFGFTNNTRDVMEASEIHFCWIQISYLTFVWILMADADLLHQLLANSVRLPNEFRLRI